MWESPFAVAGVNITFMLIQMLDFTTPADVVLGSESANLVKVFLVVTKVVYGRVTLDTTGRNAPMLVGNLVSILSVGAIHAVCSFLRPQNYDQDTTKKIVTVQKDMDELPIEEFAEEKLRKAKMWILKWGLGLTAVIVILWPVLSLPAAKGTSRYGQ